jgi:hypothetical protein
MQLNGMQLQSCQRMASLGHKALQQHWQQQQLYAYSSDPAASCSEQRTVSSDACRAPLRHLLLQ